MRISFRRLHGYNAVDDRAAAVTSIEKRETYGAVVLGQEPEVLVSSASNTTATAFLRNLAAQLQMQYAEQVAAAGGDAFTATVKVTDLVPLSANDPNGAVLTSASFPLVLGGLLDGGLISLLVVGIEQRFTALLAYSAGAGLLVATIMEALFGILQGSFSVNAPGARSLDAQHRLAHLSVPRVP